MGWWFGRKSAPADARPCVPGWQTGWLHNDAAEEGFACSYEARYREVFERNLGAASPLKVERGYNMLWTKKGLQYAPPIR